MGHLRFPTRILSFFLCVFFLLRLIFLSSYRDYFAQLSLSDIVSAFLFGIRFDISIITTLLAPILLLSIIPIRSYLIKAQPILAYLGLFVLWLFITITFIDIAYFGEVNRHISNEIFSIYKDLGEMLVIAFSSRLITTLGGLAFVVFISFVYWKLIIKPTKNTTVKEAILLDSVLYSSIASLFFIILSILFARGLVLYSKPLGYTDAFSNTSSIHQANLTLNGPFIVWRNLVSSSSPKGKSLNLLSNQDLQACDTHCSFDFSFRSELAPTNKNIVVILLESWSAKYIDNLSGNNYRATPFVDQLIEKSQVWENFYAAGQRSIIGIQAVLSSAPYLPNYPTLGFGLELNKLSSIASILNQNNYHTIMMQSSKRRSFNMEGIAQLLGFKEYYGKEDVPIIKAYPQEAPQFGWDYDTLMFLNKKISERPKDKPFFSFLFTGTTHEPFANPGEEFLVYPHQDTGEHGMLNTLKYSDWSLAQFMSEAEKQDWYKDTIFIFTADHVFKTDSDDLLDYYHIPLIIYAPDGSLPPKKHKGLASQYDILPSILDLAGIDEKVSTFGYSLFSQQERDDKQSVIMVNQGDIIGLISPRGTAKFMNEQVLEKSEHNKDSLQEDIQYLKHRIMFADKLLQKNEWVH